MLESSEQSTRRDCSSHILLLLRAITLLALGTARTTANPAPGGCPPSCTPTSDLSTLALWGRATTSTRHSHLWSWRLRVSERTMWTPVYTHGYTLIHTVTSSLYSTKPCGSHFGFASPTSHPPSLFDCLPCWPQATLANREETASCTLFHQLPVLYQVRFL